MANKFVDRNEDFDLEAPWSVALPVWKKYIYITLSW